MPENVDGSNFDKGFEDSFDDTFNSLLAPENDADDAEETDAEESDDNASEEAEEADSDDDAEEGDEADAEKSDEEDIAEPDAEESDEEESDAEESDDTEDSDGEEEEGSDEDADADGADKSKRDKDVPDEVEEVRTDKNGKKEWVYTEARGKAIYAQKQKYEALQKIVDGDDVTPEQFERALKSQQDMDFMLLDFQSGDPAKQAQVFNHFIKLSKTDQESGSLATNPLPTAARTFLDLVSQEDPETATAISNDVLQEVLKTLYAKGKREGDKNLFNAAGHIDNVVFKKHEKFDDFEPPAEEKPAATKDSAEPAVSAGALRKLSEDTKADIGQRIGGAIDKALKKYSKSYEKFPERLNNIKARLGKEIKSAIKQDGAFRQANEPIVTRATRASSERVRDELRKELAERYESKAVKVIGSVLSKIVSEDAKHLEETTNAQKRRVKKAQSKRRTPSGTPPKPKLPSKPKGGKIRAEDWENYVDKVLSTD
jgi:hypothetical protein